MVRYVGAIQRGVLSIVFVYKTLSGASSRIEFRECAALMFLGRLIPEHGGIAGPAFPKCNKSAWAQ